MKQTEGTTRASARSGRSTAIGLGVLALGVSGLVHLSGLDLGSGASGPVAMIEATRMASAAAYPAVPGPHWPSGSESGRSRQRRSRQACPMSSRSSSATCRVGRPGLPSRPSVT